MHTLSSIILIVPMYCVCVLPLTARQATFAKYGMDAEDIVALSGGHTLGRSFQKKHVCPAAHSKKINAAKKKKKESSPLRSMSSPPSSTSSSPSSPKAAAAVGDVVAKSPRAEAPGGAGVKASDCNSTDAEESESEVEEEESPHEESDHEEDDDNPEGEKRYSLIYSLRYDCFSYKHELEATFVCTFRGLFMLVRISFLLPCSFFGTPSRHHLHVASRLPLFDELDHSWGKIVDQKLARL
jgi:hypothetical protein